MAGSDEAWRGQGLEYRGAAIRDREREISGNFGSNEGFIVGKKLARTLLTLSSPTANNVQVNFHIFAFDILAFWACVSVFHVPSYSA